MDLLETELKSNKSLLALLLKGNPGFDETIASSLHASMNFKAQQEVIDGMGAALVMPGAGNNIFEPHIAPSSPHMIGSSSNTSGDVTPGGSSGTGLYYPRRLALLPIGVSQLLRRWMRLQQREAILSSQEISDRDEKNKKVSSQGRAYSPSVFTSSINGASHGGGISSSSPSPSPPGTRRPPFSPSATQARSNATSDSPRQKSPVKTTSFSYLRVPPPTAEDPGYSTLSPHAKKRPPTYMDSTFVMKSYRSNDVSVHPGIGNGDSTFNPFPESEELRRLTAAVSSSGREDSSRVDVNNYDDEIVLDLESRRSAPPSNSHAAFTAAAVAEQQASRSDDGGLRVSIKSGNDSYSRSNGAPVDALEYAVPGVSPRQQLRKKGVKQTGINSDAGDRYGGGDSEYHRGQPPRDHLTALSQPRERKFASARDRQRIVEQQQQQRGSSSRQRREAVPTDPEDKSTSEDNQSWELEQWENSSSGEDLSRQDFVGDDADDFGVGASEYSNLDPRRGVAGNGNESGR